MSLGSYPNVSLARARQLRDEAAARIAGGLAPVERKRLALTVSEAVEAAFDAKKAGLRGDGEAGRWMSPLKTHILPKLGDRMIESLSQGDVVTVLRPVWVTKPDAAIKAFQRLGIALRHAKAAGADVDIGIMENARIVLGDQGRMVTHIPAMPWQQVPEFFASLGDTSGERALKFLILTAMRSTPVRHAHAAQFDGSIWTVPAELMKGRKTKATHFRVPLPPAARVLASRESLLFPGNGGKPMSDMTLTAVLRRRGLPYRPHGFRSCFRDWATESGIDWVTAEVCLAHSVGSKASQAYARSDLLDLRRPVMEAWADHVTGETGLSR